MTGLRCSSSSSQLIPPFLGILLCIDLTPSALFPVGGCSSSKPTYGKLSRSFSKRPRIESYCPVLDHMPTPRQILVVERTEFADFSSLGHIPPMKQEG